MSIPYSSSNTSILFLLLIVFLPVSLCVTSTIQFSHNHFHYGAQLIPHPEKAHRGGEDAYFANNYVLAVADGVGGWNKRGIDPAEYARTLCRLVGILLKDDQNGVYHNNPKAIIKEAAYRNANKGSSTFVIAYLDRDQSILRTSYVGDSIYVIYRKQEGRWTSFYVATEQLISFNFPHQLGPQGSNPDVALEFQHEVQDKDIVVVGSDGLFDNMTPEQVLKELLPFIDENDEVNNPKGAADMLAKVAFNLSLNQKYHSPFAQRAKKANFTFEGGKSDDITVIVGQIKLFKKENDGREPERTLEPGQDEL